MAASLIAALWMGASWYGCFLLFLLTLNKAKLILLTLNKSKKTDSKTPVGETGCLCIFVEATASCHKHSTLASQTYEDLHQL